MGRSHKKRKGGVQNKTHDRSQQSFIKLPRPESEKNHTIGTEVNLKTVIIRERYSMVCLKKFVMENIKYFFYSMIVKGGGGILGGRRC